MVSFGATVCRGRKPSVFLTTVFNSGSVPNVWQSLDEFHTVTSVWTRRQFTKGELCTAWSDKPWQYVSRLRSSGASLNESPPSGGQKFFLNFLTTFQSSLYGPVYLALSAVTLPLHRLIRPYTTNGAISPRDGLFTPVYSPRSRSSRVVYAGSAFAGQSSPDFGRM